MLFYAKKFLLLELAVAVGLGSLGWIGIYAFGLEPTLRLDTHALIWAVIGALAITLWTLLVQRGYAVVKGHAYALKLTAALASHFRAASAPQMLGGLCAAAGEEVFFRGLIQGRFGLAAGSIAFMLAHIGKRDIRVIGYWSVFQGLGLGLLYSSTGNLVVPMLAHGIFDMGAMAYFRVFLSRGAACAS